MADVKFLSNLVVDGNLSLTAGSGYQIKNATFESLTADPTGDLFEGRMIYRSDTNQVRFYDGSAWASIAGDITGVTAGAGMTGGGSSGTVTLNVIGGAGMNVTADAIAIADDGIVAAMISGSAVTEDKLAADSVSSAKIQDNAIDSEHYVDGSIDNEHLAANTITAAKIAANAIGSSELADNAVDTAAIADLAVTGAKIAADAITGAKIADGSIDSEHLVDGSIDANHLSASSVTAAAIADNAVGASEIAANAVGASEINVSGNGTAGQVLTSDGDGTMSWTAKTTNTDVDVSAANLLARLDDISSAITLGSGSSVHTSTSGNLTVGGDLIVEGATTTVNSTTLTIDDHHIKVSTDNAAANDFGFYGRYNSTAEFAGLTYDVSASTFQLYDGQPTEPGNTTFDPDNRAGLKVARLDASDFTLGGTAVTSTAVELNKLDGFTGVVADLNYAKDLRATGVTTAEFDKLDGLTATTAELNKIAGFTGAAADLNYAKDLNATGVTATEFDYLDGVTSAIQTQIDTKQATITGGTGITFSSNTVNLDYLGDDNFVIVATDNSATDLTTEDYILVHKNSTGNVGRVKYTDIPGIGDAATTSVDGIVRLATNAETRAGTSTTRVLTPSNLSDIKVIATIGDGAALQYTVTHNLGSRRVMVQMYDSSTYETVYAQVVRTTTSAITVDFNTAPAANDVTVMVELMM
jgi:hypothetical protein